MFGRAMDFLARQLARAQADEETGEEAAFTYSHNGQSVQLTGWVGKGFYARQPAAQAAGAGVVFSDLDFLIPADQLVLAGVAVTPAKGARITWQGRNYDAVPAGGDPAWRYSDPATRTVYRVHTKGA